MIRKLTALSVTLGVVCILSALALTVSNARDAKLAGQRSEEAKNELVRILEAEPPADNIPVHRETEECAEDPVLAFDEPAEEIRQTTVEIEQPVTTEMTEVEIQGHSYIGYLQIPRLELELPIMADWNYEKLQISPCRYRGSTKTGDLVLTAHNYSHHFGTIQWLQPGDELEFVDMDNVTTTYRVAASEVVQPTEVDKVKKSGYALTMFTCTYGGRTRVVVYCDAVEP